MKTKSYNYNEALKVFNEAKELTPEQVKDHLLNDTLAKNDWNSYSPFAIEAINELKAREKYPYNGMKFVFEEGEYYPTLKTIMRKWTPLTTKWS